jgi:gamma-glutamyltranspeptidase/glutathione hydrolase/leukotriene-C4 hydrolase
MLEHPDWKPLFAPDGVLLEEGDWVNRTNYSRTLSIIAEQGPDAFYEVTSLLSVPFFSAWD